MQNDLMLLTEENIKDYIYIIRGQKVMVDSDLARIYGYTTKAFNQQVQRNIKKFDERFMFQLTNEEVKEFSRSQNVTLNKKGRGHNIKYNPYVFTEQGVYMLMTILKGEKAINQSKNLIMAFKSMKDYIISDINIAQEYINNIVLKHDFKIDNIEDSIKLLQESFNKLETKEMNNLLFLDGQVFDAYFKIIEILNMANNEIIIIDSYADNKLLNIIKDIDKKIIIITRKNNLLKKIDIDEYKKQYSNLEVIYDNSFHDRYIILDRKIFYSVGTSFNYLGNKTFGINKIDDIGVKETILNKIGCILL